MSGDYRTVEIRAGPATPSDRSELDQDPARGAPELVVELERAADTPESLPVRASVPSTIEAQERMVPMGWFG